MQRIEPTYSDTGELVAACEPARPVYCIYPRHYRRAVEEFVRGFPGRVLYAIKANNAPEVVRLIAEFGVTNFDCASLAEIALARHISPDSRCYLMNPVRLQGAALEAQRDFGTCHFVVDHRAGLARLAGEIRAPGAVIFARMAVHHESAMADLSGKFGARPGDVPQLLRAIAATGAEPALAFNVGSGVTSPDAYRHAMRVARRVLEAAPVEIRLLDIGGGFPRSYPGFAVPPLGDYFAAISEEARGLPLADDAELLAEPGRALAAPGLSVVVRVLLKKSDRIYINDGMYGSFWELRFKGHKRHPVRVVGNGGEPRGAPVHYQVFGPTCDSSDVLPATIELPGDIDVGDYLEFGSIGAYSISGRTNFNGFDAGPIVTLTSDQAAPPG